MSSSATWSSTISLWRARYSPSMLSAREASRRLTPKTMVATRAAVAAAVLSHQACRERRDRDEEEGEQIQSKESPVTGPQEPGEIAVRHPPAADEGEADQVGEIYAPLREQGGAEILRAGRDLEVEHQQRDDDGQNTIGERLEALLGQELVVTGHVAKHNGLFAVPRTG